jgi:hypothetical protein
MKVLMTLMLVLVLAGCAAGQRHAGQTIADDETTAHHAEETTVQKVAGDLKRPPDSMLSYSGQEVRGKLGSYCWAYRGTDACFDMALVPVSPKQQTLTLPSGSEMVFRYGGQGPLDRVKADAYTLNKKGYQVWSSHRALKAHGSGVERTIPAELPQGEYGVDVFVVEPQGDVVYTFHVVVDTIAHPDNDIATATPIPGYRDFEITDNGNLVHGGDVIVGKCGSSRPFAFQSASLREKAARACEKAGYSVR